MLERNFGKEQFDLHLFILLFARKFWMVILGALSGAILFGGIYYLANVTFAPAIPYEMVSDLYLDYVVEQQDTFNKETWAEIVKSDVILDLVMEQLPEKYTKEELKEAISATLLSSVKILTTTVTMEDKEDVEIIDKALREALKIFGEEQNEFSEICEWDVPLQATLIKQDIRLKNTIVLGAVTGLLLVSFGVVLYLIWDEKIYLPKQFEERYQLPCFGNFGESFTKANVEKQLFDTNELNFLIIEQESKLHSLTEEDVLEGIFDTKGPRKACIMKNPMFYINEISKIEQEKQIVLLVSGSIQNSKLIADIIRILEQNACKIKGAILYDYSKKIQKFYYLPQIEWIKKHMK